MKLALVAVVMLACGHDTKREQPRPAPVGSAAQPAGLAPAVQAKRDEVRALGDEADAITKQLDQIAIRVQDVATAVAAATNDAERATARAQLDIARKSVDEITSRIAKHADTAHGVLHDGRLHGDAGALSEADARLLEDAYKAASEQVDRARDFTTHAAEVDQLLAKTSDDLATKQSDADRAAAKAKLEELQREQKAARAHK